MGVLRVGLIEPHPTDNNKVRVRWSEAVNAPGATTAGNYTFTGGVACSAAVMVAGTGNTQTDLTLTGLVNGTTYTMTVANVQDTATATAIVPPNDEGTFIWRAIGDNNLNGVVEQGGTIPQRANREFTGDQLLGYNVLGNGDADTTLPVVTIVSPAPSTNISGTTPLVFDVTDNGAFRRIAVRLKFTGQNWEFVHDGDAFSPGYQANSTRVAISGGFRYSVRKDGGWPVGQVPRLTVYAIDTGGNEAL